MNFCKRKAFVKWLFAGIVVDSEKLGRVLRAVAALKPDVGYRQVPSSSSSLLLSSLELSDTKVYES